MRRRRRHRPAIAVAVALALVAAACGGDADAEGGGGEEATTVSTEAFEVSEPEGGLTASDIGITEDEIRIAVVADVDNQFRPGFFEGAVDGVEAYADYINERGGVAGRRLVVTFYDSKLNPEATNEALLQACENNFALVATSAVFFTNLDPIVQCPDQAGEPTGIPDLAVLQTSFVHMCSPTSYSINGANLDCDTVDDPEQTYFSGSGPARWAAEELGVENGAWIQSNNSESSILGTNAYIRGDQEFVGGDTVFQVSALDPQASYTPFIQGLKRDGVDFVRTYATGGTMALSVKEAALQGYAPEAWMCTTECYGDTFLDEAGDQAEGVYVDFTYLPFEDRESPQIQTIIDYIGEDNLDPWNLPGWLSAHLFATAAEAAAEAVGDENLTREALLEALAELDDFDNFGISGVLDIGARQRNLCFAVFQIQDGEYVRVYPEAAGELDCSEDNLVTVEFDNR